MRSSIHDLPTYRRPPQSRSALLPSLVAPNYAAALPCIPDPVWPYGYSSKPVPTSTPFANGLVSSHTGLAQSYQTVVLEPGTVLVHTGFFTNDESKFRFPSDPSSRLRVYLGVSQDASLAAKYVRDMWRSRDEIASLDRLVYRPAFCDYLTVFDPTASSDIVFHVDVHDCSRLMRVNPRID